MLQSADEVRANLKLVHRDIGTRSAGEKRSALSAIVNHIAVIAESRR